MKNPLKIEMVPIGTLKPNPRNARKHTPAQIRQIVHSFEEFGCVLPIVVDEGYGVIGGHACLDAHRFMEQNFVPIVQVSHLSEEQKRALAIALNKIPENASWNIEILAEELKFLCDIDLDVDFDVSITGFTGAEIDLVIEQAESIEADDGADALPPVMPDTSSCIRRGDVWMLGSHRLLCGDATDRKDVHHLMGGKKARTVFNDVPFNVRINGHVSGLGKIRHREFAMGSGEMTSAEFVAFLDIALRNVVAVSLDGSIHFIFMDWRHLHELLTAGRAIYSELKNLCIWVKSNGGMGSLYRSQHEMIAVFKHGTKPHINNVELGRHGRNRTNVWNYPGVNSFGGERDAALAMHPTVKPVAMVADAILDCSRRGDIVLDTFAGSGTTIIAAERTGRRARAMEIDPVYVETAIRRWKQYTGETAIHADTGLSLEELRERRTPPVDTDQVPPEPQSPDPVTPAAEHRHDR